jgi:hypothetical protein
VRSSGFVAIVIGHVFVGRSRPSRGPLLPRRPVTCSRARLRATPAARPTFFFSTATSADKHARARSVGRSNVFLPVAVVAADATALTETDYFLIFFF